MFYIRRLSAFKRNFKRMKKRGYDMSLLEIVIRKLVAGEILEPKYCVHLLKGNHFGQFECHIRPDWLLIYYYDFEKNILVLVDTGTHSDLF